MSTRGWEEGRGGRKKTGHSLGIYGSILCVSVSSPESERGGERARSHPPPPQVARSDNVDKNMAFIWTPPLGQGCNVGVAWRGVAGNVGVAWQGNVWFFFPLPSEIILFVHFNVESAFFGSVRPTRFRHGEGGPKTRHARTFTFTSTSTSTPHPHPHPHASTPYARDHPPPPHPPLHLPHAAAFPPFKTLSPLPFRREREGSRPSSLPSSPPSRHRLQPSAKCVLLTADCWGGCGGWFAGAADGRTGRRTDAGPTGPGPGPGPDPTPDRSILRES